MSGVPEFCTLPTHHGYRTDNISTNTGLDPGIRPPMKTKYRVLVWSLGTGLFLVLLLGPFVVVTISRFAAWEEVCLDRHPWWVLLRAGPIQIAPGTCTRG